MLCATQHPEDTLRRNPAIQSQDDLPAINEQLLGLQMKTGIPQEWQSIKKAHFRITLSMKVHCKDRMNGPDDIT